MILVDVNVLVYAHREDSSGHDRYRDWLLGTINDRAAYGMSEFVLSSFVRVVTHPRIFRAPSSLELALEFADLVRSRPNCVLVTPGPAHWEVFSRLCRTVGAKGDLVADAYLAALAFETGGEWVTADRDFSRFPGLHWRHPFA